MRAEAQTKAAMDRMYRWTRHVYDASRKYYLLGRDHLIDNIRPLSREHVCEIGCGTARNLVKLAQRYPRAAFCGIDASDEMLKTAQKSLAQNGLSQTVLLAQGFAQTFDPSALFGLKDPLDKIVFSYALSIIPPWRASVDHALTLLRPGGEIHIVDFGGAEDMPQAFRAVLFKWLAMFHVHHRPEVMNYLQRLELEKKGALSVTRLYRGYAYYAVFRKA